MIPLLDFSLRLGLLCDTRTARQEDLGSQETGDPLNNYNFSLRMVTSLIRKVTRLTSNLFRSD